MRTSYIVRRTGRKICIYFSRFDFLDCSNFPPFLQHLNLNQKHTLTMPEINQMYRLSPESITLFRVDWILNMNDYIHDMYLLVFRPEAVEDLIYRWSKYYL